MEEEIACILKYTLKGLEYLHLRRKIHRLVLISNCSWTFCYLQTPQEPEKKCPSSKGVCLQEVEIIIVCMWLRLLLNVCLICEVTACGVCLLALHWTSSSWPFLSGPDECFCMNTKCKRGVWMKSGWDKTRKMPLECWALVLSQSLLVWKILPHTCTCTPCLILREL